MTSSALFGYVTFAYLACCAAYFLYFVFRKDGIGKVASTMTWLTWAAQSVAFLLRWAESYRLGIGHAPLSNLYESMVFFSWSITTLYLIFEARYKIRGLGAFVTPFSFLAMAYISLSPDISDRIEPLIPALQSNWLIAHVVTCFLGYAAFAVSFGTSLAYLILAKRWERRGDSSRSSFPSATILDDLNYKSVAVGFPFLTIGIITGAAWAEYAWGSYWSWDPKETWSLITWFIYAAFLHARLARGWRGKKTAVLSIVGFAAVIFTYLGVNLVISGLHSYI